MANDVDNYRTCGKRGEHPEPQFPKIPCIRSSALSRDTSGFASRERSQGRSAKRAFIVRPLTPRTARHHSVQTKRSFVLFRIPFPLSTKARSFEIPRGI